MHALFVLYTMPVGGIEDAEFPAFGSKIERVTGYWENRDIGKSGHLVIGRREATVDQRGWVLIGKGKKTIPLIFTDAPDRNWVYTCEART
jgi:hypothetical protein